MGIIERELDALGLSHRAFAPSVGVSHSRLSRMISGVASVTVTELQRMCEALGLQTSRVIRTAEAMTEDVRPLAPEEKPSALVINLPRGQRATPMNPQITEQSRD